MIWATRQGTATGALAGLLVALLATAGFGVAAIAPLALFVLGSGVLTRVGRAEKERLGAAENNLGRRGVSHVAAKLSLPALAGVLAFVDAAPRPALALVYAAALAGAFADTAATEVGPLARGHVWGVRGLRLVPLPHGAPGGMSGAGLLAAGTSSVLIALCAHFVGLLGGPAGVCVAAGSGFIASALESLLAGTPVGARAGHFGRNLFVSLASGGVALAARALGWTAS
jgi:uncharacterized protein (TIGR00297 family)